MHLLGIHLRQRGARAVLVGHDGSVLASRAADGRDLAAVVQDVAQQSTADSASHSLGLAVESLADVDVAAVAGALARHGTPRIVSAGAAAVVAEVWAGAAQRTRHAICLWIGDTVLAGLFLDGKPWAGAHHLAGCAAWLALNPVERQDYRMYGSLAAEVSATGIARRLIWRVQTGDHSTVVDRAGDLEAITAADVFDGARKGDRVSMSVVRDTAKYIGMAVANLAVIIDPEVIVIGGPVASAGDLLIAPVRQECARRLPSKMAERFRCEVSPLGDEGVAIGAARLATSAS